MLVAPRPKHGSDWDLRARLAVMLDAGTREHYEDPELYDHEYRRRRDDIAYYVRAARRWCPDGGPILELGCGTGRVSLPLVRAGFEVWGIDLSDQMLELLGRKAARLPRSLQGRLHARRADFRDFTLRRRFPLVICPFNALMHCYTRRDLERTLATVRRHLRPGGRLVFDVMNPDLRWLSRDSARRWSRTRFRDPASGKHMIYSTNLVFDTPLEIAFMNIFYEQAPPPGRRTAAGRPRRPPRASVVRLAHRYFFPRELEALLHYNGFSLDEQAGDFDGSSLQAESEYQVCVAAPRRGFRTPNQAPRRKSVDK